MTNPNIVGAVCLVLVLAALAAGVMERYALAWTLVIAEVALLATALIRRGRR